LALFFRARASVVAITWFSLSLGFTILTGFDLSMVLEVKMVAHVALSFVVQQAALWSPG